MSQVDLDAFLLFHLCKGGKKAVQQATTKGVTGEMLSSMKHRQAFDLIVEQAANEGTTPDATDIKMLFGNIVKPTSIQLVWVITHLHRRREFNEMAVTNEKVSGLLAENDPVTAKEEFLATAERLKNDPSEAIQPTSIFDLGGAVKEEYETNESNISLRPENILMCRMGQNVTQTIKDRFKWLRFGLTPWTWQVDKR